MEKEMLAEELADVVICAEPRRCLDCGRPGFVSAVALRWYKYPMRGMSADRQISPDEWARWLGEALEVVRKAVAVVADHAGQEPWPALVPDAAIDQHRVRQVTDRMPEHRVVPRRSQHRR